MLGLALGAERKPLYRRIDDAMSDQIIDQMTARCENTDNVSRALGLERSIDRLKPSPESTRPETQGFVGLKHSEAQLVFLSMKKAESAV